MTNALLTRAQPGIGSDRGLPPTAVRPKVAALAARRGPRLLLPPVAEPPSRATARELAHLVPGIRSVRSAPAEVAWEDVAGAVTQPTAPPDPGPLCGPLVLAAVEALRGARPLAQLTRWVTPQVHEALVQRAEATRTEGPVRRATVLSSRHVRAGDRAVEATVVVHDGHRVRAAALRLELHRTHWRATVLQIG